MGCFYWSLYIEQPPLTLIQEHIPAQQKEHNFLLWLNQHQLSIFVQPPSFADLESRLRFRSTETEEKISMRLEKAHIELGRAPEFDYILLNDNLESACREAETVVRKFISGS